MESQDQVLSFPLTNLHQRQIFEYDMGDNTVLFMYDSGAQIPVWCTGKELLLDVYPEAGVTDYKCMVSGFGKEPEEADVYCIPRFKLCMDEVEFVISNLLLVELYKPFVQCDFILSETMFSHADTTTLRRRERMLRIAFDKTDRPFVCTPRRKGKSIQGAVIWNQDLRGESTQKSIQTD